MKTNDQYIRELNEGNASVINSLKNTPYKDLYVLTETKTEKNSYRDEDGDWVSSTRTVIVRRALLKKIQGLFCFVKEFWFDDIEGFYLGFCAKVKLGGHFNFIFPNGQFLLPAWYKDISIIGNGLFRCADESGIIDIYTQDGCLLIKDAERVENYNNEFAIIQKDGLYNYLNLDGCLLAEKWFEEIKPFGKYCGFIKNNSKWTIISHEGTVNTNFSFDDLKVLEYHNYNASLIALVFNDNKQNILLFAHRREGFVIELRFAKWHDSILHLYHQWDYLVKDNGSWYLCDQVAVGPSYNPSFEDRYTALDVDNVFEDTIDGGYRVVSKHGLLNYVHNQGLLLKDWHKSISKIEGQDYFCVQNIEGLWNVYSRYPNGTILPEWVQELSITKLDDLHIISVKPIIGSYAFGSDGTKKFNIICKNNESRFVSDEWFDGIDNNPNLYTSKQLIVVHKDSKTNIISKSGEFVFPEWVDRFMETDVNGQFDGAYGVWNNGLFNYYKGKYIFDWRFQNISPTRKKGYYIVTENNRLGVYKLKEGFVIDCKYRVIQELDYELYFCQDADVSRIINKNGIIVSEDAITNVEKFDDGYALIWRRDGDNHYEFNYIDSDGRITCKSWLKSWSRPYRIVGFSIVHGEQGYNVLSPERSLLFDEWFDSIQGAENKWTVRANVNGEVKYWFINNRGERLNLETYKDVYHLEYLNDGLDVVETEQGFNIVDENGNYTLSIWQKNRIVRDDSNRFACVSVGLNWSNDPYLYIRRDGRFVAYYPCDSESIQRKTVRENDEYHELVIFDLHSWDFLGGVYSLICKEDGTPLFKQEKLYGSLEFYDIDNSNGERVLLKAENSSPYHYGDQHSYSIIDLTGKIVCKGPYSEILNINSDNNIVVEQDGHLYNILNEQFKELCIQPFTNIGVEYRSKEKEHEQYYDYDEDQVKTYSRDVEITKRDYLFKDGYLQVEINGLFNQIDTSGKLRFTVWYERLMQINGSYLFAYKNNKWIILDASGQPISDEQYDNIKCNKRPTWDEELWIWSCIRNGYSRLLFIQNQGAILSKELFDKTFNYNREKEFFPVVMSGKKGLVNTEGENVLPNVYDDIYISYDNKDTFVVVEQNSHYNIFSMRTKCFLSEIWVNEIMKAGQGLFWDGCCGVQTERGFNFIKETGGILSERYFDNIWRFINGHAAVEKNGKKNFIDPSGKLVSSEWFDQVGPFALGKAVVYLDGNANLLDTNGNLINKDKNNPLKTIKIKDSKTAIVTYLDSTNNEKSGVLDIITGELFDSEYVMQVKNNKTDNGHSGTEYEFVEEPEKTTDDIQLVRLGDRYNLFKSGKLLFEQWKPKNELISTNGAYLFKDLEERRWRIVY